MGLHQKPTLRDYYSKNIVYKSELPKNWFEALLQLMNRKFQHICHSKEKLCIDQTTVPFQGRLSLLQYISGRDTNTGGYIYALKIYGEAISHKSCYGTSKTSSQYVQPFELTASTQV
nr:unnamed protein product [Callosobruchus analis]